MFKGRQVLITGATKGIGRDLAELFAGDGAHLVLVSRNSADLAKVKSEWESRFGIRCTILARDLSASGSHEELASAIRGLGIDIDVVVNNAGFGVYGKFHEQPLVPQLGMIQLHITLPTYLSHVYLPRMLKNGFGGILNVASTGGFQPVPIENVYCATKAYLIHFTEALAEELRPSPVKITCLCPGPTQTSFFESQYMKSCQPMKLSRMPSKKVALLGFEAFKKGKPLIVTGLSNQLMIGAARLAPRSVVVRAAKKFVEQRNSSSTLDARRSKQE